MKAMIFAAGLGTRLKPLTDSTPKALLPINGKPMLEHVILKLKDAGFHQIAINVHHLGDQIINFLAAEPLVRAMADELSGLALRWIPVFRHDNRNYLTFAIGCTGGQHRSVYLAETLAARLRETGETVLLRHRELDR